jgi:hypothetical protein
LGRLMCDIDEPNDVVELVGRMQQKQLDDDDAKQKAEEDILMRGTQGKKCSRIVTGSCLFTRQALHELGLWSSMDHRRKKIDGLTIQTHSTSASSSANGSGEDEEYGDYLSPNLTAEEEFAAINQLANSSSYTI